MLDESGISWFNRIRTRKLAAQPNGRHGPRPTHLVLLPLGRDRGRSVEALAQTIVYIRFRSLYRIIKVIRLSMQRVARRVAAALVWLAPGQLQKSLLHNASGGKEPREIRRRSVNRFAEPKKPGGRGLFEFN